MPMEQAGKTFWRSLDELAGSDSFRQWLQQEFPAGAFDRLDGVNRRQFLKVMAASFVLMGVVPGCEPKKQERLVPYVNEPDRMTPGAPLYFATTLTQNGYGTGVLAESHTGRPTKIEGNEVHPASLGATDIFVQAEVLTVYDPDRSQSVRHHGEISTWDTFIGAFKARLRDASAKQGRRAAAGHGPNHIAHTAESDPATVDGVSRGSLASI